MSAVKKKTWRELISAIHTALYQLTCSQQQRSMYDQQRATDHS